MLKPHSWRPETNDKQAGKKKKLAQEPKKNNKRIIKVEQKD